MTAEPIEYGQPQWLPDPVRQRLANYTIEDILSLPNDSPRVELIDGVMRPVPSPTVNHQQIASLLWLWLRTHAPNDLTAIQAVGVAVAFGKSFEPDVLVRRTEAMGPHHFIQAQEVLLVAEVVSPNTQKIDRFDKPRRYAEAGIPYFWRVEQDPVHVYAYKLVDGSYQLQTDSAEDLALDEPFPIRLSIKDITP